MIIRLTFLLLVLCFWSSVQAQKGELKIIITDDYTLGSPLKNVVLKVAKNGHIIDSAKSDSLGRVSIELDSGIVNLIFSYPEYCDKKLNDVRIENEIIMHFQIELKPFHAGMKKETRIGDDFVNGKTIRDTLEINMPEGCEH